MFALRCLMFEVGGLESEVEIRRCGRLLRDGSAWRFCLTKRGAQEKRITTPFPRFGLARVETLDIGFFVVTVRCESQFVFEMFDSRRNRTSRGVYRPGCTLDECHACDSGCMSSSIYSHWYVSTHHRRGATQQQAHWITVVHFNSEGGLHAQYTCLLL